MAPAINAATSQPKPEQHQMENGIMAFTVTSFPSLLAVRHMAA